MTLLLQRIDKIPSRPHRRSCPSPHPRTAAMRSCFSCPKCRMRCDTAVSSPSMRDGRIVSPNRRVYTSRPQRVKTVTLSVFGLYSTIDFVNMLGTDQNRPRRAEQPGSAAEHAVNYGTFSLDVSFEPPCFVLPGTRLEGRNLLRPRSLSQ